MTGAHTYLVLIDYPPDMVVVRAPHRQAHLSGLRALAAAGRVVMAGGYDDPLDGGMLLIRAESTEEVEALVKGDAYAEAGLMRNVRIRRLTLVDL